MSQRIVCTFDGLYSRLGVIAVEDGKCTKCGTITAVLAMDGSEGEYEPGRLCKGCINEALPDIVPLCPVCSKPAPVRAWCSPECEAKDGAP